MGRAGGHRESTGNRGAVIRFTIGLEYQPEEMMRSWWSCRNPDWGQQGLVAEVRAVCTLPPPRPSSRWNTSQRAVCWELAGQVADTGKGPQTFFSNIV